MTSGVLCAVALDDSGGLKEPVRIITAVPFGDKVGHFMAFGLLTFFVVRVFPGPRLPGTSGHVPLSVAVVFALTALEELSQAWIPWRHCDFFDLVADATGMALFTWLALTVRVHRPEATRAASRHAPRGGHLGLLCPRKLQGEPGAQTGLDLPRPPEPFADVSLASPPGESTVSK